MRDSALSTETGSPGRIFSYSFLRPVTVSVDSSFSKVLISLGSSPNRSMISAFVPTPSARISVVTGTFLVRSTRTQKMSLASVSYSSHAPLFGMTVQENSLVPALSLAIP